MSLQLELPLQLETLDVERWLRVVGRCVMPGRPAPWSGAQYL